MDKKLEPQLIANLIVEESAAIQTEINKSSKQSRKDSILQYTAAPKTNEGNKDEKGEEPKLSQEPSTCTANIGGVYTESRELTMCDRYSILIPSIGFSAILGYKEDTEKKNFRMGNLPKFPSPNNMENSERK
ncbi:hypothetical protein CHS0354_027595 [Potamilus streckersoni]|uniref:Uncharacterized protein n=1 Tax=Potamilus streckersoni TaxID=2493646 RepID=A0AAE0S450_9BIVA|nr:hypothetical protein CHS0354_027595 [Potamilus streckersoni]